jgi:hypothetical protein
MATIGQILRDKDQRNSTGENNRSLSVAEIKRSLRERDKPHGTDSSREAIVLPGGLDKNGNPKHTITYKHRRQARKQGSALEQRKAALKEKIKSMKSKESVK